MVVCILGLAKKSWIKLGKGMRIWRLLINIEQRRKAHSAYNFLPVSHAWGRLDAVCFSIQSLARCLSLFHPTPCIIC